MTETVAVLGASPNPARYSFKAVRMLTQYGHTVLPVNPAQTEIDGIPVVSSLGAITTPVDTLTLYVGPAQLPRLVPDILALRPGRVIFNPGTEVPGIMQQLQAEGIPCEAACTLVLLRSGLF
ncbi:CoA-binding protein [Perlucidibaca piscinae]|uniref:CoA-binding protein n=1 Tax=Perlucidibaca piscinae TaxID=392589 RepID=UPI0003B50640|nr:CoA-binding protein [Perlucidibaca piscinae]